MQLGLEHGGIGGQARESRGDPGRVGQRALAVATQKIGMVVPAGNSSAAPSVIGMVAQKELGCNVSYPEVKEEVLDVLESLQAAERQKVCS